jgi:hypothetical protein
MIASDMPTIDYVALEDALATAQDGKALFNMIVNAPFQYKVEMALLFLGIIVLLLVDNEHKTINRVALTNNDLARGAKKMSVKRFEDIKIPLNYPDNSIAEAIRSGKPQETSDWKSLFIPELTPQEARFNQAGAGVGFSAIYPLNARDGGALIFSYYQYPEDIGGIQHEFMRKYTKLVTQCLGR